MDINIDEAIKSAVKREVLHRLALVNLEINKIACEQILQMGFRVDEITENGEPPITVLLKHLFAREESDQAVVNQRMKILSDKITVQILKKLDLAANEETDSVGEGRTKNTGAVGAKKKSTRTVKGKTK